ncbi:VWA domain-containing protein [Imperialibacter roseus]|uniref:VWA domain-containing protein n=1 Tax=Imperialibacter roseus TaxID=1324217 RepID=A0ABZ0IKL1_9BACT|nr:VWA domain-containing protein [Imperialibacter roseus]WOK05067.1 VWA domain-containing protein [Imperialibacter roseus]
MKVKFSPSVNIIRDESQEINYIVTPNVEKKVVEIEELIQTGFRAFTIIGSYGSGKSSFLWALEGNTQKKANYFESKLGNGASFLKIVGEYASLRETLAEKLNSSDDTKSLLAALKAKPSKAGLFLIVDEFGKFLEYAVRNDTEKEIYFLQQLAEYVAEPSNNCILITTLHQSFEAYATPGLTLSERNEWKKVKGRFKDITFNEPVEQLLYLASKKLSNEGLANTSVVKKNIELQRKHSIVKLDATFLSDISSALWPLDLFSGYLLAVGLQRYGQNERSLFTFLEGELDEASTRQLMVADIFDYLYLEFYSYLGSDKNYDYNTWRAVSKAIERAELLERSNTSLGQAIIKVIGVVSLLGHKGAKLDKSFLINYLSSTYSEEEIEKAIDELESRKIILFTLYNNAYRVFEGTDVDFKEELKIAGSEIDGYIDVPSKLREYFKFSVVSAKAVTYQLGTPRFFQHVISENPIEELPKGQIDGFINLVFSETLGIKGLKEVSKENEETLYAKFENVQDIREILIDIERTTKAMAKHHEDFEARKEFENILHSHKQLLNRSVLDALYTDRVSWIYKGERQPISSNKELNKKLSEICRDVYSQTPSFRNELVNRHILQGASGAKNPYFKALVTNYHLEDLGFAKDRFPAEKTIYLTLLKETGIHHATGVDYEFARPNDNFQDLWKACESFLASTKSEKKKITVLFELLSRKPFKLTQGFLDFWIPTFLFIKRDDFALFSDEEAYQPEITDSHLYFFTRDASKYSIKAFDVEGIKLNLYNKYRELLQLKDERKVNNQSLIESVKPFMVFHHHLNTYAKTTNRITPETKALRQAIEKAEDPEKLFFEEFPSAIGIELKDLLASPELFDEYIKKMKAAIRELQGCFDQLMDRIEKFILLELFGGQQLSFQEYKSKIDLRFGSLKEHMLIPQQTALLIRLRSPLDDRNSWLNSLSHVLIGKSLEVLRDKEEEVFKEKLKTAFKELDNLVVLTNASREGEEKIMKVDITSLEGGSKEQVIRIPAVLDDEALDLMNKVKSSLGKNDNLNKFILANLLKQLLND